MYERRREDRTVNRSAWKTGVVAGPLLVALVIVVLFVPDRSAEGFDRYRSPSGTGWCSGCHGSFITGQSPSGTVFPFGSNHLMHRASSAMNTECNLCHADGDQDNPWIARSDADGYGGGPGSGCLGCHGRDYGKGFGVMGVGLREVHRNSGVSSCGQSSCHQNDPDPLPENVPPPYYGSYETRAWDQCNRAPFFGENFSLDEDNHRGLDNDGDGLYDEDDPDCEEPPPPTCPEDIDGDGEVTFDDLVILLSEWGPCEDCASDIDGDGEVSFDDLVLLLSAWGECD